MIAAKPRPVGAVNRMDPAAFTVRERQMYERLLKLLGEEAEQTQ